MLQLLLLPEEREPHEVTASYFVRLRPDLQDICLTDPDVMLVGHTAEKGNFQGSDAIRNYLKKETSHRQISPTPRAPCFSQGIPVIRRTNCYYLS